MSEVIMIVSPGKWVSEEQLIALKGIKKGTLKKAREKSFMEGREYKHVAHGNDSNLLIVFYVQIMPDDFVMQLHR
ncbi:excisionase family protein, partial [Escherichia coli]|nr:excisionase family protein [Escherichia coli]